MPAAALSALLSTTRPQSLESRRVNGRGGGPLAGPGLESESDCQGSESLAASACGRTRRPAVRGVTQTVASLPLSASLSYGHRRSFLPRRPRRPRRSSGCQAVRRRVRAGAGGRRHVSKNSESRADSGGSEAASGTSTSTVTTSLECSAAAKGVAATGRCHSVLALYSLASPATPGVGAGPSEAGGSAAPPYQ